MTKYAAVKLILLISVIFFILSLSQKNKLPDKKDILPQLYQEPAQTTADGERFKVSSGEANYWIEPVYEYELYGLVVSYHHSAVWWDYYHKEWGDSLNVKDICVIWGDNIETEVYKKMSFSSGSWTCYPRYTGSPAERQETHLKYKPEFLSNNHILAESKEVKNILLQARKGDQIYLKGYLANYYDKSGNIIRKTSISRNDKLPGGKFACETVYLTDFKILKAANKEWRFVNSWSKYLGLIASAVLVIGYFKAPVIKLG